MSFISFATSFPRAIHVACPKRSMAFFALATGMATVALVGGLAALTSPVEGSMIRISGPNTLEPGNNYTWKIEAENSGLGDVGTRGIEWRPNIAADLVFTNISNQEYPAGANPPASSDFYGNKSMFYQTFLGIGSLSSRIVSVGNEPVNSDWKELARYDFTVNSPGTLPKSDTATLTDVAFYDPNGDVQWSPAGDITFDYTITPEPTTLALFGLGTGLAGLTRRLRKKAK